MTELEYRLDEIDGVEGKGTQLVSLYIPPDKSIQSIVNRLKREHAEAENIKSKQTREGVQRALTMSLNELQTVPKQSDSGIAIFAGVDVDDNEHTHTAIGVPVNSFRYHCDSEFLTEPLRLSARDDDVYGLIVVERRAATVGRLVGNSIEHIRDLESDAKGKHSAGGFSNRRFDRLIEESTSNFYDEVAEVAEGTFDPEDIDGIVVGGSNLTKDDFLAELSTEYQDMCLGTFSVEYHGNEGLEELVRRSEQVISDSQEQTARRACDEFFSGLRNDEPVEYGRDQVERAAEMGAVDSLLIDPDVLYSGEMDSAVENVEEMGGSIVEIPRTFEDGRRLCEMSDGIAAILRYPIN